VGQPTINRLRKKRRTASPQLALAIEKATKGVVKRTEVPLIPANRKLLARVG
jgi:DNA-binding transcriptional regulator YdaS (Cro superfamily)